MATQAIGALPAAPAGIGTDPEASQEYSDALSKVLSSLENRNQTNWFSVAGQLLDPGRTGNFGEALGRASSELGRQQEKYQEQEPNVAMMRAQIAGQKYTLGNDAKALQLMGANLGMDPTDVTQAMNSTRIFILV